MNSTKKAPYSGLGRNILIESSYAPKIEGQIPRHLNGTLYRLGPGLFERNGYRKNNLLDGDGLMQAFSFQDGQVHYKNSFVKTKKYLQEEMAQKFLYNTWTTNAPDHHILQNPLSKMLGQAGIAPAVKGNLLYAFDDIGQPYVMNPETLETYGESNLGQYNFPNINAHTITDGKNGDWIIFGHEYGYRLKIHLAINDKHGNQKFYKKIKCPRLTYMHDFFATENYVIFCLSAMSVEPFPFLLGLKTFTASWKWKPSQGNLLCIVDKRNPDNVQFLESEARWIWHGLNAYEIGNEIIMEYCGYDDYYHFSGDGAQLEAAVKGEYGDRFSEGHLRRYKIDLIKNTVKDELLIEGNFDFPSVNPIYKSHQSRLGYFTKSKGNTIVFDGLCAVDFKSQNIKTYELPEGHYCGEPVFAGKKDHSYSANEAIEPGHLLSLVYDSTIERSYLAIFDTLDIQAGPVSKIHLNHHSPISFHGHWEAK